MDVVGRINPCGRSTVGSCPCADCRHARFNPGPPSKAAGWYGHFRVGVPRRRRAARLKYLAAWDAAIVEDAGRESDKTLAGERGG